MRAVVIDRKGLRFESQYPEPVQDGHETVVRVLLVGICNTDIEILKGYMDFRGVPGHEFVGIVESSDWPNLVGKRVVGEINCPCGTCPACRAGRGHHCPSRTVLGIFGRDGAFAERLVLPAMNLHVVPNDVSDEDAVFTEPLAAAFRIPEQMPIDPRTRAVVLGAGKLGNLVAQVLKLSTPNVMVVGRHKEKLALLASVGIETALTSEISDVSADLVVDCTGSAQGLSDALKIVRAEGTVVVKSTVNERTATDVTGIVVNEVTVVGSRCGPFLPALRALEDRSVVVKSLVSDVIPIEQVEHAFDLAQDNSSMKVLMRVS
ncbi:MAG: alcohol dehydrogenase catalytic domain-containing protein [Candidatus Hydrogenedentes bacterium]|nr:alcohol dehydrogenase catalytic domain-containing protein [Candidatus Hydrogenedentota bacterium]